MLTPLREILPCTYPTIGARKPQITKSLALAALVSAETFDKKWRQRKTLAY
jgi:hypothetical protein